MPTVTTTKPPGASSRGSSEDPVITYTRLKLWLQIATRMIVGGFFAFCAVTYLKNAVGTLEGTDLAHITLGQSAAIISILAISSFMGLVAYLYAVQLPPLTRFAGWKPAAAACIGSFSMVGLMLLEPRHDLSPAARLLSAGLIITGNSFAVYSLNYLRNAFSILPQARRLVAGGPYHFIRHPIYLAEAISIVGVLINFLSVPALALLAVQLSCQILRMNYEERVLSAAFPEYEGYRRRTARMLPGIY